MAHLQSSSRIKIRKRADFILLIFLLLLGTIPKTEAVFASPDASFTWKDTFPTRPEFMVGALANDYLSQKIWGTNWQNTDPWHAIKENGGGWARVWVTNIHSKDLNETPVEKWNTLPWKDEYWSSQEYAEEILREAQDRGLRLDLVFFLGDTANYWGRQNAPSDWKELSVADTALALENYTYVTATYYKSRDLNIEVYEIGNEIQEGILNFLTGDRIPLRDGVNPWSDVEFMKNNVWNIEAQLLKGAISGLRRADPDAKIVLHAAGLGISDTHEALQFAFFQSMVDEGVDFDYAGITLPYPWPNSENPGDDQWTLTRYANHTWFQHMDTNISSIAGLGKKVMICEASYPNRLDGILCGPMPDYPFTPAGQADWLHDQLLYAANNEDIVGWFYWYPDYFPGVNPDPAMKWLSSLGLFVGDSQAQPALKEFLLGRVPASFVFSRMTVSPTSTNANRPVTVEINVQNAGGVPGLCAVDLKVNGVIEESKEVALDGGAQTTLSFTINKVAVGSYNVEVGSLSGGFDVKEPSYQGIDGFPGESVFVGLFLIVFILICSRSSYSD